MSKTTTSSPIFASTDNYYDNTPKQYINADGYVQVAKYMRDHGSGIERPKQTKKDLQLQSQLVEWSTQYWHFINRKNRYGAKLEEAGHPVMRSKKYRHFKEQAEHFHTLMRENRPAYIPQ